MFCYIKRYKGNLKQNLTIHGHNTKSKLNFHVQFCNTVLFQESVVNISTKLYNKVPEYKKRETFKLFKKELKSVLLSHFLYSADEFLQFWVKLICKVFLSALSD